MKIACEGARDAHSGFPGIPLTEQGSKAQKVPSSQPMKWSFGRGASSIS
jgi:hypothetical protein